jgi:drug/metabolite transporter (DMT)-like permease
VTTANRSAAGGMGLTLALLSAASFGTSGTFASALIDGHWSPAAAVLGRTTLAAVALTVPAVLALRGRWRLLRRHAWRVLAFGLIAVAGCQLCYFNAIERMPIGVALLLEYLGAVLVVAWMWARHGQRPRRLTVAGAFCAIAGLAMVLDLTGSARINPVGVLFGLLAATGLAVYFVLSAAQDAEPLPSVVMAWASMCVGAGGLALLGGLGVLPLRTGAGQVLIVGHQVSWLLPVIGLALVSSVIPYVSGIGAARRLGAKVASFVGMAEVLFAILFAWLLLGQLPSGLQFAGGAFIVAGVALVRVDELAGGPGLLPRASVDPLPEQVSVAVVPGVLLDHVHEHVPERERLVTVAARDVERVGGASDHHALGQRRQFLAGAEHGAEVVASFGDAIKHGPDRESVRPQRRIVKLVPADRRRDRRARRRPGTVGCHERFVGYILRIVQAGQTASGAHVPLPADEIGHHGADGLGQLLNPDPGVLVGQPGYHGYPDLDAALAGDLGLAADAHVVKRRPVQPGQHQHLVP